MDNQQLWQTVLDDLAQTVSRANLQTWIRDTFIVEAADDVIVIGVPNTFYLGWIKDKFHKNIADSLRRLRPTTREISYKIAAKTAPPLVIDEPLALQSPALKMRGGARSAASYAPAQSDEPIILDEPIAGDKETIRAGRSPQPTFQPAIIDLDHIALTPTGHTPLDPVRTFDSFIVGNSNRLAHAVSLAAAKSPGLKYNPLFLYGGVGLGKTHLAQAIGNEIRRRDPVAKIVYVSCDAFINDFIESLHKKSVDAFKKRYRYCDVLLIDDVQFMSGKERTQEEFFHTFNALHQSKKQIVMTADREPHKIPAMEERLTSRFAWGMVADVQPPDLETRVAILRAKRADIGYAIEDAALQTLAEIVQSNIRDLEGALQQVVVDAQTNKRIITPEFVQQKFVGFSQRTRGLNAGRIIQTISEFFELTGEEVMGQRRYKELVYPRQLAMYLMRHELSFSYPKIGKELGGKDHTTIMHGVEKIEKEMARNSHIQYDLSQLKERLYQNL